MYAVIFYDWYRFHASLQALDRHIVPQYLIYFYNLTMLWTWHL